MNANIIEAKRSAAVRRCNRPFNCGVVQRHERTRCGCRMRRARTYPQNNSQESAPYTADALGAYNLDLVANVLHTGHVADRFLNQLFQVKGRYATTEN